MPRLLQSIGRTQAAKSVYFDFPKDQIPSGGMSDGQNVEPRGESPDLASLGKAPGWRKYSATAVPGVGPILDIKEFIKADGSRAVMAVSTTRASKYNTSTNVFDDVTGGANLLTATATVPVFTATLNDLFIVGDKNDAPRKYTGAAWALLGGSPPTCLGWDVYEGHLLGWNQATSEFTAQWSDLNAPETWGSGEAGALSFRDHNLLALLAGAKMGRNFLFYKEQLGGIYAMTYVGLPTKMVQELIVPNFGVFSPRGVLAHDGVHYVMGSDEKLYAVTLGGKQEIAQGIRKRLFSRLNWNVRRAAYVTVDPLRSLILFCIPTGSSGVPDRAYLYNYRTGGTGECEWPFACAMTVRDPETTLVNDLAGTIDALVGRIDELSTLGKDILMMGSTAAAPYVYRRQGETKDGEIMVSYVVGAWQGAGDGRYTRVRGIEVDDASGSGSVYLSVGVADGPDQQMQFTRLAHAGTLQSYRADCNVAGRWVAGKFEVGWPTDMVTYDLTGYRYDADPVGRR